MSGGSAASSYARDDFVLLTLHYEYYTRNSVIYATKKSNVCSII